MLICLGALLINMTTTPFNTQDFKAIKSGQERCKTKYNNGCLRQFQKREQGVYRILCGEKQEFDKKALLEAEKDVIIEELQHLPKEEIARKLKNIGMAD